MQEIVVSLVYRSLFNKKRRKRMEQVGNGRISVGGCRGIGSHGSYKYFPYDTMKIIIAGIDT